MKKVLIITYYWPPSGGGGVQRWLKFAKYLPQSGWEPVIFTPENPDFDTRDESLFKDVNDQLEVIKLPIWEPYSLFAKINKGKNLKQGLVSSDSKKSWLTNLALFVRGNFFIPDPRRFWVKLSIKFLSQIIEDNAIDVIVTTGPPHSMHLIGLGLKKKLGIKWVADFRDPWSKWDMLDQFKMTSLAKLRHKQLERKVLEHADKVLTVSNSWAKEFKRIYNRKYEIITNGFDEDDFENKHKITKTDGFVISHFGLINQFRNPVQFWEALKTVIASNPTLNIQLNLFGTIASEIAEFLQNDEVLKKVVQLKAPVSHDQVLIEYQKSNLLLLLLNDSENALGHLPGKLFEYMASNKFVLALGPVNGDCAKIIDETGIGSVLDWKDLEGMQSVLADRFASEKRPVGNVKTTKYSRRALTKQLSDLLNSI